MKPTTIKTGSSMQKNRQQMYSLAKFIPAQKGASVGSLIFNLILLILIGFAGVKIGGLYVDDYNINKALQELDSVPYVSKKSGREIQDLLDKKFRMNNTHVERNEILVDKLQDRLVVEVSYERRVPLFSNIDVILTFSNKYETVNR